MNDRTRITDPPPPRKPDPEPSDPGQPEAASSKASVPASAPGEPANDDRTRVTPVVGPAMPPSDPPSDEPIAAPVASEATRITIPRADDEQRIDGKSQAEASADDATRVAPATPAGDTGTSTQATTGTQSNWAHPERWRGTTDAAMGPGSVLKDRFLLDRLLGQGGMGSVYRALDRRKEEARDSQPYVAVKLLNDDFRRHPDALMALQREAKKAQLLAHPNIVTVYDFDRDGTQVFMTMEHLQGEPLDVVIRRVALGGLPFKEAMVAIDRMARGLAYAHKKGIAHADFKPGNVFLTEENEAKILDFGIARAARIGTAQEGDHTQFDPTSLGALTPAYASLEMLEGQAPEPADDVYALACVAQELLTGKHPFLDGSGRKLSASEVQALGQRPTAIPNVPKRIQRALLRGLAMRRADRFADAGLFLDAIKPRARLARSAVAALIVLGLTASVSWYLVIQKSDMMVTLEGLPVSLEAAKDMIREGDRLFEANDVPQAYTRYALAWDQATQREDLASRDQAQLRVIIDRRSDAVADYFITESQRTDIDPFSLELLQLTLESLVRTELGTRRERLERALEAVDARLKADR